MIARPSIAPLAVLLLTLPLRAAGVAPASRPAAAQVFPLSQIIPVYYHDDKDNPPLADLLKSTVSLVIDGDVYTAPTKDQPGSAIALQDIGSAKGPAHFIDRSAIDAIYSHITKFYNDHNLIGIFTVIDAKDINHQEQDIRNGRTTFTFIIIVSHVTQIRTIRLVPGKAAADIDDPADADILKNSPIQPDGKTATRLLNKKLLDDYTAALKKAGKNVNIALSGTGQTGEVTVNFLMDFPPPATTKPDQQPP